MSRSANLAASSRTEVVVYPGFNGNSAIRQDCWEAVEVRSETSQFGIDPFNPVLNQMMKLIEIWIVKQWLMMGDAVPQCTDTIVLLVN